jgi:hypothetical protein
MCSFFRGKSLLLWSIFSLKRGFLYFQRFSEFNRLLKAQSLMINAIAEDNYSEDNQIDYVLKHIEVLRFIPVATISFGEQRSHNYETRLSRFNPIVMPIKKDKYFEHTFEYIVPRLWNMLPLEQKIITH